MVEEEYIPKRGDIVQWVDGGREGEIGIVIGWSGKDILYAKNLQNGEDLIGSFESEFILLLRKDQYEKIINDLPHTANLTDTEPET
jgi:hypothetical protein